MLRNATTKCSASNVVILFFVKNSVVNVYIRNEDDYEKNMNKDNELTVLFCNAFAICSTPDVPMLFCARFSVFNVCFKRDKANF